MTPEDRIMVEKLRNAVKDNLTPFYDTDFNLLRWLQGHNYDMDIIVPKLRYHLRFRQSCWDLDNMHKCPRDHVIQAHWPDGLTGYSGKENNAIVIIEQAGAVDYRGMLLTYSLVESVKSRMKDLELMLKEVMKHEEKTGKQSSIIYIIDLNGLKHDKYLLTLLAGPMKFLAQFMADHYVEVIKYFVLVNAPSFMRHIWWIIYPLLPEHTKKKVRFLGNNWREEILEYADANVLPTFWNLDGESTFTATVPSALKYDEHKYFIEPPGEDYTKINVGAGNEEFISVFVEQDAILKWKFHGNGDMGFGVFFANDEIEKEEAQMDMVYPQIIRVTGPIAVPLMDSLVCKRAGVYKFWLSNRHAWWHTLKIQYRIWIESDNQPGTKLI